MRQHSGSLAGPLHFSQCVQHSQTWGSCLAVCCPQQLCSAGPSLEDILARGEGQKGPSLPSRGSFLPASHVAGNLGAETPVAVAALHA